jgi:hypothetical protein
MDAAYQPRTIMDIDLCNYKVNQAFSRINISDYYKIVIKTPKVYCGVKR